MSSNVNGSNSARQLRIAQISPLYESVPPRLYGGTERIVYFLTEELVRRGHEVTLFASGDSVTGAKLEPMCPSGLRLAGKAAAGTALQLPMLSSVFERAHLRFDIIHSHLDFWAFPFEKMSPVPSVATIHSRLDDASVHPVYNYYRRARVISISGAQRSPLPHLNWAGTVHHGLPRDLFRPGDGRGGYLAFLGRMSPEKGPHSAIEIAKRAGVPLKIAAKVDEADREYFETVVKPQLSPPDVEFIGEVDRRQKNEFLGSAMALLFPIDWPEPFGLTMIEALACGTPVITRPFGSVPEIIKNGVTGCVASSIEALVDGVKRCGQLSRAGCRAEFESRFTAEKMVDGYEEIYRKVLKRAQIAQTPAASGRNAAAEGSTLMGSSEP